MNKYATVGSLAPRDWKVVLGHITGSVDQELLLRNEYLATENGILRNQLKGRLRLTYPERMSLAEIGKRLVWAEEPCKSWPRPFGLKRFLDGAES